MRGGRQQVENKEPAQSNPRLLSWQKSVHRIPRASYEWSSGAQIDLFNLLKPFAPRDNACQWITVSPFTSYMSEVYVASHAAFSHVAKAKFFCSGNKTRWLFSRRKAAKNPRRRSSLGHKTLHRLCTYRIPRRVKGWEYTAWEMRLQAPLSLSSFDMSQWSKHAIQSRSRTSAAGKCF